MGNEVRYTGTFAREEDNEIFATDFYVDNDDDAIHWAKEVVKFFEFPLIRLTRTEGDAHETTLLGAMPVIKPPKYYAYCHNAEGEPDRFWFAGAKDDNAAIAEASQFAREHHFRLERVTRAGRDATETTVFRN